MSVRIPRHDESRQPGQDRVVESGRETSPAWPAMLDPEPRPHPATRGVAALASSVAAFAITYVLLRIEVGPTSKVGAEQAFTVWLILVSILVTLSVAMAWILWPMQARLGRVCDEARIDSRTRFGHAWMFTGIAGLATIAPVLTPDIPSGSDVDFQFWKSLGVAIVVFVVAVLPGLVALSHVTLLARTSSAWEHPRVWALDALAGLRRVVHVVVPMLSLLIVLIVVAATQLREAVKDAAAESAELTPVEPSLVILFGAAFTFVLSGVAVVVLAAVGARGRSLLREVTMQLDVGPETEIDDAVLAARDRLTAALGLGREMQGVVTSLVITATPLLTALLSNPGG